MLKPLTNKNIKYNHQLLKEQNKNKNKIFERTSVNISLKEQNKNEISNGPASSIHAVRTGATDCISLLL